MLKGSILIGLLMATTYIHVYTSTAHASCNFGGYVYSLLCTTVSIVYREEHEVLLKQLLCGSEMILLP